ncbi:hypothetical protein [Paenibacillus phytohabitans]|uniref:hypothetical protein n=1 Tax=Paenibacillus phytohabitans TaxID=2654978 RepID=UPI003AB76C77
MKLNPAHVAVLFLVVRIIAAIGAPLLGVFIDKVRLPLGKYTPCFFNQHDREMKSGFIALLNTDGRGTLKFAKETRSLIKDLGSSSI